MNGDVLKIDTALGWSFQKFPAHVNTQLVSTQSKAEVMTQIHNTAPQLFNTKVHKGNRNKIRYLLQVDMRCPQRITFTLPQHSIKKLPRCFIFHFWNGRVKCRSQLVGTRKIRMVVTWLKLILTGLILHGATIAVSNWNDLFAATRSGQVGLQRRANVTTPISTT